MKETRHTFTPSQKVAILRLHLMEKKPVSEICPVHDLATSWALAYWYGIRSVGWHVLRLVSGYVAYYNAERLHSGIKYITPKDKLEGKENEILQKRDEKKEAARERRKAQRQAARVGADTMSNPEVELIYYPLIQTWKIPVPTEPLQIVMNVISSNWILFDPDSSCSCPK